MNSQQNLSTNLFCRKKHLSADSTVHFFKRNCDKYYRACTEEVNIFPREHWRNRKTNQNVENIRTADDAKVNKQYWQIITFLFKFFTFILFLFARNLFRAKYLSRKMYHGRLMTLKPLVTVYLPNFQ